MNLFIEKHQQLLQALDQHNVDYIIIGGYSVIFHGYKRTTGDVDIWLRPSNQNKSKLINALRELNFEETDLALLSEYDFTQNQVFHIWEEPEKVDFITRINLVQYEEADKQKVMQEIEGINIPFIHINHLILSKINTGRAKDQADIEELQKIQQIKKEIDINMEKLISEGKCLFCGKSFKKSGITRHLDTHLREISKTAKAGQSYLIKMETPPRWGTTPYFLMLWIDGNTSIEKIDYFLRRIWLECCGHMSAFRDPKKRQRGGAWDLFDAYDLIEQGKIKEYEKIMEESVGEVPKSRKAKDAFNKGLTLQYEYDFGSTTELQLTVTNEYPMRAQNDIVLLSRNEPPEIMCDLCHKQAATQMCAVCQDEIFFCDKCAKKHAKSCPDFEEYAAMPVVNSPRMGVCAYMGGEIDKERDGVFMKQ